MKTEEAKSLFFFGFLALLISMLGREKKTPQKKLSKQSEKIILPGSYGV